MIADRVAVSTEVAVSLPIASEAPEAAPKEAKPSSPAKVELSEPPKSPRESKTIPSSSSSSDGFSDGEATPPTDTQSVTDTVDGKSAQLVTIREAPLSLGQSRFYYPSLYLEDKSPFNCTFAYNLDGPLDVSRLGNALQQVTQRHEILRTAFGPDSATGKGVQRVLDSSNFVMKTFVSDNNGAADVKAEFKKLHSHSFDLERGETLKATLISHSSQKHTILFSYHHIVMDGVSWQIFMQDMAQFYNNTKLAPVSKQFIDFSTKQSGDISANAFSTQLDYWKTELATPPDEMPLLPFAKVKSRQALTQYKTREIVTHFDKHFVQRVKKSAQALRATSFHFWLAAFQVMLYRLLDVPDLCVGVVDANRSDQTFAKTIGFLLEIVPIRTKIDGSSKFSSIVQNVRSKVYGALGHSGAPIEEIVRACGIPTSATHTPLFQVLFNYRMGATKTPDMGKLNMALEEYADATTPFDISVSVDEKEDGTGMVTFEILEYLYDRSGADIIVSLYRHFLDTLSRDASVQVSEIPKFPSTTTANSLALGTGPAIVQGKFPHLRETVSKSITPWAVNDPNAPAVKDMTGAAQTYSELLARSDVIAGALQQSGVGAGSFVCVLCEPCVDMGAYVLAILRLGAVYVPLDVRNSDERLKVVAEDSEAKFLLFHTATKDRARKLRGEKGDMTCLNLSVIEQGGNPVPQIKDESKPEDVAVVLYTSGSTGRPKGMRLTNTNLAVNIESMSQLVDCGRETVLQQSALGFDAAVFQLFMALCHGGRLVVGDNRDPAEVAAIFKREKITMSLCMISEMSAIIRYGWEHLKDCTSWRIAFNGGEQFSTQLAEQYASLNLPNLGVYNVYGPTECTIVAVVGEVPCRQIAATNSKDLEKITIGRVGFSFPQFITGPTWLLDQH
jgi:non-ribosomal peptide synthetase component F